MPPRFMTRMAIQVEMQKQWHRDPQTNPPPYQDQQTTRFSDDPPAYRSVQQPPPAYRPSQYSNSVSGISLHSFPDRATVLVIGACTRQGMHIIDRLLEHDYRVRGVVSNAREAAQIAKYFEVRHDREHYNSWIIPDMSQDGAFSLAARSCSGIIFVTAQSSPIASSDDAALARVTSALTAAMKEAGMDRFIYCSPASSGRLRGNSLRHFESGRRHPLLSSELDREHTRPTESRNNHTPIEVAIWDWVDKRQPGFALDISEYPSLVVASLGIETLTCVQVSLPRDFGMFLD